MNQISLERLDSPIKDEYNDKDEEDDQEWKVKPTMGKHLTID